MNPSFRRMIAAAASLAAVALVLGATASAETVIVRNDFSYAGVEFPVQCPTYSGTLTVVSGDEHQMAQSHYNNNGELVWYSEHQTHSALKVVSDTGETFVLQEVDNIRYTDDFTSQHWVGQNFYLATGPDRSTVIENWRVTFVSNVVDGVLIFDHYVTTC
jgi:hypothetical protein